MQSRQVGTARVLDLHSTQSSCVRSAHSGCSISRIVHGSHKYSSTCAQHVKIGSSSGLVEFRYWNVPKVLATC
jgi:hypothetical protein